MQRKPAPETLHTQLPHLVFPYTMYGSMNRFLHQPKILKNNEHLIYSRAGISLRQSRQLDEQSR